MLIASPALADSTLTVDLSSVVRPATHVGNGSLYGVTEKLPADVMATDREPQEGRQSHERLRV
jgi:hypothetical protein